MANRPDNIATRKKLTKWASLVLSVVADLYKKYDYIEMEKIQRKIKSHSWIIWNSIDDEFIIEVLSCNQWEFDSINNHFVYNSLLEKENYKWEYQQQI